MSEFRSWRVPNVPVPVRSRVRVPEPINHGHHTDSAAAVAFAAAGLITGGTVLVRNWPSASTAAEAALGMFADMGGYVVSSADGLTVTGRSTTGILTPVSVDLTEAVALVPLLLVVASLATGESRFSVSNPLDARSIQTIENLGQAGAHIDVDSCTIVVTPAPLHGLRWPSTSVADELAGLLLGVAVEGITVTAWDVVEDALPGMTAEWLRMLSADEYLVPGSARLPRDYLETAGD